MKKDSYLSFNESSRIDINSNEYEMRDYSIEKKLIRKRVNFLRAIILLCFLVLFGRYAYLQIIEYDYYLDLSDNNRTYGESIPPNRGEILDRNGITLATNVPVVSLISSYSDKNRQVFEDSLNLLTNWIDLTIPDIEYIVEQQKENNNRIVIKSSLTSEEEAIFSINRWRFPSFFIEKTLQRTYPYPEIVVHSVGYVGRINREEIETLDKNIYRSTHLIGKSGIEKQYEDELHGFPGISEIEVNARGIRIQELSSVPAKNGKNIKLYMDFPLQLKAYSLLNDAGHRGSIVAIDPKTGGILSMVSVPGYNSNLFVNGISSKDYNELLTSIKLPLINRSISGKYPPASTIKPYIGLIALNKNITTPEFSIFDRGYFKLPGSRGKLFRNWKRTGHGRVNLFESMKVSNDTYFFTIGVKMGIDIMSEGLKDFGYNQRVGLDIYNEGKGLMPDRQWKRENKYEQWYPGDTANTTIGQGYVLSTPLQMAYSTSILANKGLRILPRMVDTIDDQKLEFENDRLTPLKYYNDSEWDLIEKSMIESVHGVSGTAYWAFLGAPYLVAGKTGTAQLVSLPPGQLTEEEELEEYKKDHALFIAYAPAEDPKIAIAIIIENGTSGGGVAAPLARELLDFYLLDE